MLVPRDDDISFLGASCGGTQRPTLPWRRNDRSIRSAPFAERTSSTSRTSGEVGYAAHSGAYYTPVPDNVVCVCMCMRAHTTSLRSAAAAARQNIRTDRSDKERGGGAERWRGAGGDDEQERKRKRIEGARRNATGLSSPLINTSKATCKAARVGSRAFNSTRETPISFRIIRSRVSTVSLLLFFCVCAGTYVSLSFFLYHWMIRFLSSYFFSREI